MPTDNSWQVVSETPQPPQSTQSPTKPPATTQEKPPDNPWGVVSETPASVASSQAPEGVINRTLEGIKQSLKGTVSSITEPIKAAIAPPTDAKEQVVHAVGGLPALDVYRAGRSIVDSAENLINSEKESYQQSAQDFQRAITEFHNKDYRNAASSVGSFASDMADPVPGSHIIGSRLRELTEGTRPGGNLATPLAKDVTDVGTLALAEKAPEAISAVSDKVHNFLVGRLTPEEAVTVPPTGKFQPATNLTPKEVLDHAKQEGIELTPGQALKTKPRQAIQGLGERAFIGGGQLEEKIAENRQALTKSVSNFADVHDPLNLGKSEETSGDTLQKSAQEIKDTVHSEAKANYENLPPKLLKAKVDVRDIRQKWQQIRSAEEVALQNLPPETASKLRGVMDNATKIGTPYITATGEQTIQPYLRFKDAQKLRSALREMGETTGADLPARYQGMYRKLTSDLDDAMQKAAKETNNEQSWRDANQGWKYYSNTFGERTSPLYRILNQADPAKVTRDILNRGSAEDIDILKRTGVNLAPLKRQVITDIANAGYRVGREGLAGYSDSFLNSMFGPVAKRQLYLKAELGRRLGFEVNPSGTSNVLSAEMQIPTSKEGLIRGVGGSTGFAKISTPRPTSEYLPKTKTPPSSGGGAVVGAAKVDNDTDNRGSL